MNPSVRFDVVGVGLNATDTLLVVPHFPPYGGKVAFKQEVVSPGGQVASAMAVCSRLGLRAKYIGAVGDDEAGRIQMASLHAESMDVEDVEIHANCPNQRAYIVIDQSTGEPTLIQNIETRAIHPRTFHIDPSGRMLVAQHNLPVNVRDGNTVRTLPAGLSVLRIGDDGKLTFVRKYDVDVGDKLMFWMGMVPL